MGIFGKKKNKTIAKQRGNECPKEYDGISGDELASHRNDLYRYSPELNPVVETVMPYEEHIKKVTPTNDGLYPPEVVLLYFCNTTKKYPAKNGNKYPIYWWHEYGIADVDTFLEKLEDKGLIELRDGVYSTTSEGEECVKRNEAIVWAHKTKELGGAWEIMNYLNNVPDERKMQSWKDRVWFCLNRQAAEYISRANKGEDTFGLYRNTLLSQAKFLEYEKKYINAIDMYETVLKVDVDLDKIDRDRYRRMGISYEPIATEPAPGIVQKIEQLKKKVGKK